MLDPDTKFFNPDLNDTVSTPGGGDYDPGCITFTEYVAINTWEEYDVAEVIKEAVKEPELFHGFIIKQFLDPRENRRENSNNRSNQGKAYYSSDYDEIEKRPKLTITYTSTGVNTPLYSQLKDDISIMRKGERIIVFVSFEKAYDALVFNMQGEKLVSLTGGNKGWVDLPVNHLSSGINILTIKIGQTIISKRFSFIR